MLDHLGFLVGLNNYIYDLSFRFKGTRSPADEVVIVAIDEKTLAKLGRWPISRTHYIDLLTALKQARTVGFDIILQENTKDDPALGRALKNHGRVVLPAYIDAKGKKSYPAKALSAAKIGHIHLEQSIDGTVRKVFNTIFYEDVILPSFAATLHRQAQAIGTKKHADRYTPTPRQVQGPYIYQKNLMVINFYGPPQSFPYYSFSDVIEGKWAPSFFKDKIVLVGLSAPGLEADILTPFSQDRNRMPGVEVHAHIINNLMDKTDIKIVPRPVQWAIVMLGAFFLFYLLNRVSAGRAAYIWLILFGTIAFAGFILLKGFNLWYPPALLYIVAGFIFILAYIYNLQDLTRVLKRAEKDWQDTFNTIDDAIAVYDKNCRLVRANHSAKKTFGKPLIKLLTQKCQDLLNTGKQGVSLSKEGLMETAYLAAIDRHVEIKTLPRLDEHSRFEGLVHIVRDISERIEAEKAQQDLQQQLIRSQKMEALGTLAGGIAHDFNNILSAILGYTELAIFDIKPENQAHEKLAEVLTACERAKELVQQILTFSKQADHDKKPIEVGLIVTETLKLMRPALPATIQIKTDIQKDNAVMGEATQLHQIFMNLCTNAYHAMRESGGVLAVTVDSVSITAGMPTPSLDPGPYVRIRVQDSGKGIPPEVISRIFDPYFTTKNKEEGTGLGLSVVHGIVQIHKGTISVESEPHKGSIFTLLLPKIIQKIAERKTLLAEGLPKGDERIMVVDDEVALAKLYKTMLGRLGYEVVMETDGIEALENFRKSSDRYDLVITDTTMPGMTGLILAKELLKIKPGLPIIICTGFSELVNSDIIKEIGIRALVMKPIVIEEIAHTIRDVLASPPEKERT
jgi:PAS domain S-box-containing protein